MKVCSYPKRTRLHVPEKKNIVSDASVRKLEWKKNKYAVCRSSNVKLAVLYMFGARYFVTLFRCFVGGVCFRPFLRRNEWRWFVVSLHGKWALFCSFRVGAAGWQLVPAPGVSSPPPRSHCMLLRLLGSFPLIPATIGSALNSVMKPLVVFVLGGPGAGKGTQCERIVEKYGYTHLSAGDLLRNEQKKSDSEFGELIKTYIKDGQIVPVEITISLLQREMDETMAASAQKNRFLIDGFPRNEDNMQGWNKKMEGKAIVSFVLFFDCDNETCIDRCLERGKSSGRTDDNRESLEKRIKTYLQSTKPIIDQYEKNGKVKKVDASKSVDEVFSAVQSIFDKEG